MTPCVPPGIPTSIRSNRRRRGTNALHPDAVLRASKNAPRAQAGRRAPWQAKGPLKPVQGARSWFWRSCVRATPHTERSGGRGGILILATKPFGRYSLCCRGSRNDVCFHTGSTRATQVGTASDRPRRPLAEMQITQGLMRSMWGAARYVMEQGLSRLQKPVPQNADMVTSTPARVALHRRC